MAIASYRKRNWLALLCIAAFANGAQAITLDEHDAHALGQRIAKNETGGDPDKLVWWNRGEHFASLGIGHFIWYPAGVDGPFKESFPALLDFMEKHGAKLPVWLSVESPDCPWTSREQFLAAGDSPNMQALRALLIETVALQSRFMAERLQRALPEMLDAIPAAQHTRVQQRFERLTRSPNGLYALLDYVNFKGEGTRATERYSGQGWGLLQVLDGMRDDTHPVDAFADAAARVLTQRVANSPTERDEARWLPGWLRRLDTYRTH